MAYDSQIIRIQSDTADVFTSPYDLVTGNPLTVYSGNTLDIKIALFTEGALASTSGFASATIEIKPRNADGSVPDEGDASYAAKSTTSFNESLTLTDWLTGAGQHFVISFTDTEMKIPAGNHWISCYIVTSGGDTVIVAAGDFIVKNPGTDTGTPTYVDLGASYYTATQSDARYVLIPSGSNAKGDIIVHNGTTWSRLAKGTDTHLLTADSTAATGLKWAAGLGGGTMNDVVDDATPQLGGDLDVNGNEIQSVSGGDIEIHSDNDINLTLGDTSGVDDFNIKNSSSVKVFGVDSGGNLTLSGTVDGRDLVTDGTKLDGIEAGADVTDTTNVTNAGAVMDGDFSSDGIMTRTAAGVYTSRTITGTSNQITVTNGDGDSGNPTIGLTSNPTLPGTEAIVVSGGTTAQRPGSPVEGHLRKNTSTNVIEYYNGSTWLNLTQGATGGLSSVVDDTTPQLGGNLDTNTFEILFPTGKGILDSNLNEQLLFTQTASAANYLNITNSVTTVPPSLGALGSDTNIDLDLLPKGTGQVNIKGTASGSAGIRLYEDTDNGSNYVAFKSPSAVTTNTTWTLPNGDGSANQQLKTDGSGVLSWQTPTWTLVSSATASSSSSIDFTNLASSYSAYMLVLNRVVPATDSVKLYVRADSDNGASFDSGANYYWARQDGDWAGSYSGTGGISSNQFEITALLGNSAGKSISGIVYIIGANDATYSTAFQWNTTQWGPSSMTVGCGSGMWAGDVNAVTLFMSSGNIASGTFKLYGLSAS